MNQPRLRRKVPHPSKGRQGIRRQTAKTTKKITHREPVRDGLICRRKKGVVNPTTINQVIPAILPPVEAAILPPVEAAMEVTRQNPMLLVQPIRKNKKDSESRARGDSTADRTNLTIGPR